MGLDFAQVLWELIDYDMSNSITWDELFVVIFPELKEDLKLELTVAKTLRETIESELKRVRVPDEHWVQYLRTIFDRFDVDGSGCIDKDEFRALIEEFGMTLSKRSFEMLFAAVNLETTDEDLEGSLISWYGSC